MEDGEAQTHRLEKLRVVVRYMVERWTRLTRFVNDPRILVDSNAIERGLRGPAVGRKNHCGSKSLRGTQVAAHCYTLCETAELVGVDPHAYLLRAVDAAMAQPSTVTLPETARTYDRTTPHSRRRPARALTVPALLKAPPAGTRYS